MDKRQCKGDTMKRTLELRTLSEEHHHGLVRARRLRRERRRRLQSRGS
jgi:hypothetical protein